MPGKHHSYEHTVFDSHFYKDPDAYFYHDAFSYSHVYNNIDGDLHNGRHENIYTDFYLDPQQFIHCDRDADGYLYIHCDRDANGFVYIHGDRDANGYSHKDKYAGDFSDFYGYSVAKCNPVSYGYRDIFAVRNIDFYNDLHRKLYKDIHGH
jgi:hypothetical protein